MNRDELYEILAEKYDLKPDVDFYQLHGKWIIKHDAVRKLAGTTSGGCKVVPPSGPPDVFKGGEGDGVYGREVVLGGEFCLVSASGDTVKRVYAIGEANEKNVKIAYPWSMAYKRMYDRGVLDILSFAQLGVYSDIEADVFERSAEASPPTPPPKKPAPPSIRPAPPKPSPPSETPPGPTRGLHGDELTEANHAFRTSIGSPPPPEEVAEMLADPMTLDDQTAVIFDFIKNGNKWGTSLGECREHVGWSRSQVTRALKILRDSNMIRMDGKNRGARYHVVVDQDAPTEEEAIGADEFDGYVSWLVRNGVSMIDIQKWVKEITGHSSGRDAIRDGVLTAGMLTQIAKQAGLDRTRQPTVL